MCKRAVLLAFVVMFVSAGWAGAWTVPSTGITKCYDTTGEITCPNPGQAFYGQNGNFPGQAHAFVDNGDTATDQITGLVWQKTPDGVTHNWDAAAAYCTGLGLDNQSDWRLPTQREHLTIVDSDRARPAFAGPLAGTSGHYWSATPYAGYTAPASWYVNFVYGSSEFNDRDTGRNVRCVRGQTLADDTYVVQGNVVVDTTTGLIWEKTASAASKSWAEALAYCQNQTVDGYTDWRLPDIMELRTLVDYTKISPAINNTFVGSGTFYWSSSTLKDHPDLAGYVDFTAGTSASDNKTRTDFFVRCLRNSSSRTVVVSPIDCLLLQ